MAFGDEYRVPWHSDIHDDIFQSIGGRQNVRQISKPRSLIPQGRHPTADDIFATVQLRSVVNQATFIPRAPQAAILAPPPPPMPPQPSSFPTSVGRLALAEPIQPQPSLRVAPSSSAGAIVQQPNQYPAKAPPVPQERPSHFAQPRGSMAYVPLPTLSDFPLLHSIQLASYPYEASLLSNRKLFRRQYAMQCLSRLLQPLNFLVAGAGTL